MTYDFRAKDTLCWRCGNACGGCSWSREFEPVKGWKAKATLLGRTRTAGGKNKYVKERSYTVKHCPEFVPDGRSER